jgi:hypothetical protein
MNNKTSPLSFSFERQTPDQTSEIYMRVNELYNSVLKVAAVAGPIITKNNLNINNTPMPAEKAQSDSTPPANGEVIRRAGEQLIDGATIQQTNDEDLLAMRRAEIDAAFKEDAINRSLNNG